MKNLFKWLFFFFCIIPFFGLCFLVFLDSDWLDPFLKSLDLASDLEPVVTTLRAWHASVQLDILKFLDVMVPFGMMFSMFFWAAYLLYDPAPRIYRVTLRKTSELSWLERRQLKGEEYYFRVERIK